MSFMNFLLFSFFPFNLESSEILLLTIPRFSYLVQICVLPVFDLRGSLRNVKETQTKKAIFSPFKEVPSTTLSCKTLLGGISLMSSTFLLYFHSKQILKLRRIFEKVLLLKIYYKNHYKSFIKRCQKRFKIASN